MTTTPSPEMSRLAEDATLAGFEHLSVTVPDGDEDTLEFAALAMGSGPLALCLHGYPDSAWTWRHLLPALASQGYRAVAPFNRGYAPTQIPTTPRYQAGVLGVDANSLHEALGGDGDAVLIGHDWGAMGAYAAASLAPERWRRIVAAAVPPGPVVAEGFFSYDQLHLSWYMFFQLTPMADMVVAMNDHEFISRLWQDWSPGFDGAEDVARFAACVPDEAHLSAALDYYRHTLQPELQAPELADAQAAVFSIPPQPLLYLHGRTDGCMSPTLAATSDQHMTVEGSRTVMVDGAGHFLQLERPEVVNAEILAFLAE